MQISGRQKPCPVALTRKQGVDRAAGVKQIAGLGRTPSGKARPRRPQRRSQAEEARQIVLQPIGVGCGDHLEARRERVDGVQRKRHRHGLARRHGRRCPGTAVFATRCRIGVHAQSESKPAGNREEVCAVRAGRRRRRQEAAGCRQSENRRACQGAARICGRDRSRDRSCRRRCQTRDQRV